MYDRTVFKEMRFHKVFQRDEDYVFWLEILIKGVICKTNKQILATYYLHKNSKNSEKRNYLNQDTMYIIKY